MPIDNRSWYRDEHPPTCSCVSCVEKRLEAQRTAASDKNLTQWEHSWRYQQWKIEKRISEKEAKAEWIKWAKEQGWQLGRELLSPVSKITLPESKPSRIPKPLWIVLAIAIIFFMVALLV